MKSLNDYDKVQLVAEYNFDCTQASKTLTVSDGNKEIASRRKLLTALLGRKPTDEEMRQSDL